MILNELLYYTEDILNYNELKNLIKSTNFHVISDMDSKSVLKEKTRTNEET